MHRGDRWTAESNLRSLKTFLRIDILRGQTHGVARKGLGMHVLAYNVIRLLTWRAATDHGRGLHRWSFKGTLHRLRSTWPMSVMLSVYHRARTDAMLRVLLQYIGDDLVPDRPEPRRRKRRPKNCTLLQRPRDSYRRDRDPNAR